MPERLHVSSVIVAQQSSRFFLRTVICGIFFLLFAAPVSAQRAVADSVRQQLRAHPDDRKLNSKLFDALRNISVDSAYQYAKKQLVRAEYLHDSLQLADAYANLGICTGDKSKFDEAYTFLKKSLSYTGKQSDSTHRGAYARVYNAKATVLINEGRISEAISLYDTALAVRSAIRDSLGMCSTLILSGDALRTLGDFDRARQELYRVVTISRAIHSLVSEARAYNNLANVYQADKRTDDALSFYRKSLEIKLKLGSKRDIGNTYGNMGVVYYNMSKFDSALYYYQLALPMKTQAGDMRGAASTLNNIGLTYIAQNDYKNGELKLLEALELRRSLKEQGAIGSSYNALSGLYIATKTWSKALLYADSAVVSTRQTGSKLQLESGWWHKAEALAGLGRYQEAYANIDSSYRQHNKFDSIQKTQQSAQMKAIFDLQGKDKKILEFQNQSREAEVQHRLQLYMFFGAGLIVLLVLAFVYVRYRSNQRSRARLQQAYNEIETKNRDITDSIRYARHIQEAILPDLRYVKELFPGSFVLYKPKDIVSGDFYWATDVNGGKLRALAVADCTGHGVPGAFMSVVGTEQLYRAAQNPDVQTPSQALAAVDEGMRILLKQRNEEMETKDGMDIAICAWFPEEQRLLFSGAFRPLYLVRKGKLIEYEASRVSIGGTHTGEKRFIDHDIALQPGDMFYLFTDGFADQFGGPDGKKFKQKQLKDVLCLIAELPPDMQRERLDKTFEEWRGKLEQVDDVCVIGVRV